MPLSSPPSSPPQRRHRPRLVGRAERCCAVTFKLLPLVLVYGLTTWAIWSQGQICLRWDVAHTISYTTLFISLFLYAITNWCYTIAVFTDPGSPLHPLGTPAHFSRHNYSFLPLTEPRDTNVLSLTVKSSGATRFCKKCQCKKPDRAHHCSTCGRCVLKMDHHCPWLATCVGLRNYKPFLLFCIYVTIFCWVCFGTAATFVIFGVQQKDMARYGELFAVNSVLLAIVGGILGLVLTGFTGWHISLAWCNQTTIECLEKTRYLRPIRRTMERATQAFPGRSSGRGEDEGLLQHYGHQLAEMHANAIPGITRAEEGEEHIGVAAQGRSDGRIDLGEAPYSDSEPRTISHPAHPHPGTPVPTPSHSTATTALRQNFAELEAAREHARYESYLDEQDGEKMPNAFDLGWQRNLIELFGDVPLYWMLPICNTHGDGWRWEPSAAWLRAQEDRRRRREARGANGSAGSGGSGEDRAGAVEGSTYSDGIWDGAAGAQNGSVYDEHFDSAGIPRGDDGARGRASGEAFRGIHEPIARSVHRRDVDVETGSTDALFAVDDGLESEEHGEEEEEEAAWGW